jgi:ubiquinone biosynthesis protein
VASKELASGGDALIREAFKDLKRVRQITVIAAKHGFGEFFERTGLKKSVGFDGEEMSADVARTQSAARRFRMALTELGPTFVKLGQVLSTRADLIPAEVIQELASLQDNVAPISFDKVRAQIEAAFSKPLTSLFSEFSKEPLAAASMAQVHRAVTFEGASVIVKVQRPDIEEQMRADLSVLHSLARALEAVIEEAGLYSPTGIIEEFDRAVHEELDFLNEAANLRAFHRNYASRPGTHIPKVFDELTARTVLTMEFVDAPKLNAAALSVPEKQKLAAIILEGAFHQLFEDGLFHGDPHPGNLLVSSGPTLTLIDFGLVGRVTRQMQETLVQLVLAVGLKDSESVARILYRLGTPDSRTNLVSFRQDIDAILGTYLPTSLKDIDAKNLITDILNLAVKYKIRIPREYAILSRASIATEGILRSLYPDMPIGQIFFPYAKKLLSDRYDPAQLQTGIMKALLRFQNTASDLPIQLQQLMLDLESGKFTVTMRNEHLGELVGSLRSLAVVMFVGLCACGFIIGTFISLANKNWEVLGVPVLGLLGIACTLFLFSTAIVRQTFTGMKKVSLSRWLNKKSK